jgi:hypothetical protein
MGSSGDTADTTTNSGWHGGFRVYTGTSIIKVQFPRQAPSGTESQ